MASKDLSNREMIKIVLEFKDEIKQVTADYKTAMATLDTAVKAVNDSKVKPWVIYKTQITIGVTLALFLLFIWGSAMVMSTSNLCIVSVGQKENSISIKSCSEVKQP